MSERPLFQVELLERAKFPRLDDRGVTACHLEGYLIGLRPFLEEGWERLEQNTRFWVGGSITLLTMKRKINLSTCTLGSTGRFAMVRQLCTTHCICKLPIAVGSMRCLGPLMSKRGALLADLDGFSSTSLWSFISGYDGELARLAGEVAFGNSEVCEELGIDPEFATIGMCFTYFALVSRAESLGMERMFVLQLEEGK